MTSFLTLVTSFFLPFRVKIHETFIHHAVSLFNVALLQLSRMKLSHHVEDKGNKHWIIFWGKWSTIFAIFKRTDCVTVHNITGFTSTTEYFSNCSCLCLVVDMVSSHATGYSFFNVLFFHFANCVEQ